MQKNDWSNYHNIFGRLRYGSGRNSEREERETRNSCVPSGFSSDRLVVIMKTTKIIIVIIMDVKMVLMIAATIHMSNNYYYYNNYNNCCLSQRYL